MSACDKCRNPGQCCSGFFLNSSYIQSAETELEVLVRLASVAHTDPCMGNQGVPFLPLFKASGGSWLFWCPRLGRDGRCTDYENRPALCRSYQPKHDKLCVEWDVVPPASEPIMVKDIAE